MPNVNLGVFSNPDSASNILFYTQIMWIIPIIIVAVVFIAISVKKAFHNNTKYVKSANVVILWDDIDDMYHVRPRSVFLQLYLNGKKYLDPVTVEGESSRWNYMFTGLPDAIKGRPATYTAALVNEYGNRVEPKRYATEIRIETGCIRITNTLISN